MEDYEEKFGGKKIIITGGLGFIGSNLAHRLTKLNPRELVLVDSLVEGCGGNILNIEGIRDKISVPEIEGRGIDISFYHHKLIFYRFK